MNKEMRTQKNNYGVTLLLLALLMLPAELLAQAKTLYAVTRDEPYAVVAIDPENPTAAQRLKSVNVWATAGAIVKHTMYVVGLDDDFNTLVYSADLATGDVSRLKNLGESAPQPVEMTYDYTNETMYFVTNSLRGENGEMALYTLNLETFKMTSITDDMGQTIRAIAVDAAGQMYGLSRSGQLYLVNKTTGKVASQPIGSTGRPTSGFTSMEFDRASGMLYWTLFEIAGNSSTSTLLTIDPATAAATELGRIGAGNGLYCVGLDMPYEPSADTAPAKVDNLTVTPAEGGLLSATISWANPTLMANGDVLASLTKVEVMRGDELVATLTEGIEPGTQSSYTDTTVPQSGEYRYTVRAYNEVGASADRFTDVYVGHDLLKAPDVVVAAFYDSKTNIVAWTEVTEGQHGGYVDLETVVYDVIRLNDQKVIVEGMGNIDPKLGAYIIDAELADTLTRYVYQVVARNSDGRGEAAESNALVNGPSATMPFTANFDRKNDADLWTVLDVNQDGYTFIWHRYTVMNGRGLYIYQCHPYNFALDMIITPPVEFQEGHSYKITVEACNSFAPYPEAMRLYSLPGYTTQGAVPITEEIEGINHPHELRPYEFFITTQDDGLGADDEKYTSFIGVTCTSNPAMQMLLIGGVTIEDVTAAGITDHQSSTLNTQSSTYNLRGQRVSRPTKGLYIRNGKKMLKN